MLGRSCKYAVILIAVLQLFVTALLEYLDAVQDERQSVTKGLLVKMGVS